jgi:formylglycine-generating enzyme required for sulfatase activity
VSRRPHPGAVLAGLTLFFAVWVGLPCIPSRAQDAGKKLALLVGIDRYPSGSGFSSLPFPQRDVNQLAQLLRDSGYQPEHVRVLTREESESKNDPRFLPIGQNVLTEFRVLAGDRKPQDSLLVALVGHGLTRRVRVKDAAGNDVEKSVGFFCPMNADIRDTKTMISLDELYSELEQCKAGVKVMLVDACRNDPTEGNSGAIPFAPPPVPPSVAALFSCSDGEVAWEERELGGGHGVFFHFVIEGLGGAADGNKDGKVSLLELTEYTQDKVPEYVSHRRGRRQMPVLLGRTGRVTLLDLSTGKAALARFTTRVGQINLKRIPAGTFLMGSSDEDKEAYPDEAPQHGVRIGKPFYLGVTEVTQRQYQAITGENPSHFKGSDDLPVEQVSWLDAVKFCNQLSSREGLPLYYRSEGDDVDIPDPNGRGYRLPTEAEWEYACRAGSSNRFTSGITSEDLKDYAWFGEGPGGSTHPVGGKKPNALGLFDIHGNVLEWCWDRYAQYETKNEKNEGADRRRVLRGGAFSNSPRSIRCAKRFRLGPAIRDSINGFRIALNAE